MNNPISNAEKLLENLRNSPKPAYYKIFFDQRAGQQEDELFKRIDYFGMHMKNLAKKKSFNLRTKKDWILEVEKT